MSPFRMAIAAAVVSALSFLIHGYVWLRLVRDPAWPAPWGRVLTVTAASLAVLVPLAFLSMRWTDRSVNGPVAWVAYLWLGFAFYLLLLTGAADVVRGVAAVAGALPNDPARRTALWRLLSAPIAAGAALIGVGGIVNVARGFEVRRVRVPLTKLPSWASGYTIVHLTDIHVGPTIGRAYVERIVRETNALVPDMVVITGDLVDGTVAQLERLVEPLRGLRAADGVFFVTGNHEYYSGADEWIAHLGTLGVRVLRNELVSVRGAFDLAGVDDASAARMLPHHGQDVGKALATRDPSRPVVLLAHQPKALRDALRGGVDLQLSGHVHGGQMVPFNWLARLDQPLIAGLYRIESTWVYVSMGTGYWGPPMRVGTTAELTHIELVSGGGSSTPQSVSDG
ncbi:MAG: metallophosphoesterase [Myxococcota bacterium]|nr:metallophosphoesterase [Myxococcota bacterium]